MQCIIQTLFPWNQKKFGTLTRTSDHPMLTLDRNFGILQNLEP